MQNISDAEDELTEEIRQFYESLGMDPEILPKVKIEFRQDKSKGVFRENDGDYQIVLYHSVEQGNHRIAEGIDPGLKLTDDSERERSVHEGSHAYFEFFFNRSDLFDETAEVWDESFSKRTLGKAGFHALMEAIDNPWDCLLEFNEWLYETDILLSEFMSLGEKIRKTRYQSLKDSEGEEVAAKYMIYSGLSGINENLARIAASEYAGDPKEFRELHMPEDENIPSGDDFSYVLKNVDILGVDTEEMNRYIEQRGYRELMELDEEELIDRFYEPVEVR